MKKTVSGTMLTLLLIGMLTLAFNIHIVETNPATTVVPGHYVQTLPALNYSSAYYDSSTVSEQFSGAWDFDIPEKWRSFASMNADSAELVIAVEDIPSEACSLLTDLIGKYGGEVVNKVFLREKIRAVVADVPLPFVGKFVAEAYATISPKYIEPNLRFKSALVPNDPFWSSQWGPAKIEADQAWDTTVGSPSVLVAVVDTGIDWDHPDLHDNYVALGYDWVNDDSDPMDDNGHGTHCAGIIAATINNNMGIAGLAQAQIMSEKGLNSTGWGNSDDLANAIIHAVDQGADIISMSWGDDESSSIIYDAITYAYDSGVLLIAAAGNDATSDRHYPAIYNEVIAVTATSQSDEPASFTNYGDWVELAAPGVNIYSTVWDNSYTYESGTSMACPHVAGVAALIGSQFPSLTRDQVRVQLWRTAEDLGKGGFDEYFGYGRVNARSAVAQELPQHDLVVCRWDIPVAVTPDETATLNVTVGNFGRNVEDDIEVQLIINGSLVNSNTISSLVSGELTTTSLAWTPTAEGTYNATSYIMPVADETATSNNALQEYITARALIPDIEPPAVTILSPENRTYKTDSIPLTFEISEPTSWVGFSLDNNANVTVTGNITLTSLFKGSHSVVVCANDTSGNMGASDKVYFTVEFLHDVAIVDVTLSKTIVCQGFTVEINVTAQNQEDAPETFNVTAYANETVIETREITLASGNSTTITFTWNTTGYEEYKNHTISAYAHPVPGETSTDDNTFTDGIVFIVHIGDVNADGEVRIDDVLAVALAFGSKPGHPRWEANCDINCDGQVRVDDILVTALEFGYTKP